MEYRGHDSKAVLLVIRILTVGLILLLILDFMMLAHNISSGLGMLQSFATIFLSIILEGFPFIIIGAFVSALIQIFISEETIARVIPKRRFLGVICAALAGFVFPICECAIVPIVKRLIKKGVPTSMAVTFMLATPIVNPVVLISTYYAFSDKPYMVFARAVFGMTAAIIIGWLTGVLQKNKAVECKFHREEGCACGHCGADHHHHKETPLDVLREVISHTSSEFYDIGRLFIFGALLSAFMQTFISKDVLLLVGRGRVSSVIIMMITAYVLSICSETDAFIARTFAYQFTFGSVLGFLIFGPMLDIKNTVMLCGSFNFGFVIKLIFLIVSVCFLIAVMSNCFIPGLI